MGAWIEMSTICLRIIVAWSHSSWVRGLKSETRRNFIDERSVALFMGAWIEMQIFSRYASVSRVALFMGAWIEMPFQALF